MMRIMIIMVMVFGSLLVGCSKDTSETTSTPPKKDETSKNESKEPKNESSGTDVQIVESDWKDAVENSDKYFVQGNVKVLKDFPMNTLNRKRNIWIYLPESYDQTQQSYPVMYMQDGQSLFKSDDVEWKVDETITSLTKEKKVPEVIVVGIESDPNTRFNEYAPWKNPSGDGGEGDLYADFLAKELKPYIDKHYRTMTDPNHTGIAGASMGGYISLFTAVKYPTVFGKVAAFSPIIGFNKPPYIAFIEKQSLNKDVVFYMDSGEKEEEFPGAAADVKEVSELLLSKGIDQENLKLVIDQEGEHNKTSWSKRFPSAIEWLLNKN